MNPIYTIFVKLEHYAFMVDLLGALLQNVGAIH
jgi:hypothetical protein